MNDASDERAEGPPLGAFATVFLTVFLDLVAFGIMIPVLPYYAEHYGASPAVVTLLSASFSLAQFVMSPVLGRLSDRVGRRHVLLISIAGAALSSLTIGLANSLWIIFLGRVVSGVSSASVSTAHAYVADRVAPMQRAKYMGMMGSAIGLGFIFGPAIGGLLSTPEHPNLPFFAAAGLSVVNWILAFFLLPKGKPPQREEGPRPSRWQHAKTLFKGSPIAALVAVNFIFYLAFSSMESTFALLMEARLSWGARETGFLFTGIGVVIIVTQGFGVGRAVKAIGERRTLVVGMLVLSVGLSVTGTASTTIGMVVGSAGIAAGNGLISPTITALVSRSSRAHEQGLNIGVVASAAALARIFGPTGAGVTFETAGPGIPMLGAAGFVIVAALLVTAAVKQPQESE